MMVTLINARGNDSQTAPFGLMYMAAVLEKEGHRVEIFDPMPGDYSFLDKVKKSNVIGFGFLTTEYMRAKKIISLVRDKAEHTVVGGVHVTAMPEKTLKEFGADFAVVGEGEYTMRELVERLEGSQKVDKIKGLIWKRNNRPVFNGRRELIQNLDGLPFPARHLLDYEWYLRPPGGIRGYYLNKTDKILTSRGCPYNCLYCGSCSIFGRMIRRRSVENVIEEIRFLKERYKLEGLCFLDDSFVLDDKWVTDFCREIKKLDLTWACQNRVDRVKEDVLREMKGAGCVQVEFGIESGSDRVLKALRKGTTAETQRKAFRITKRVGMKTLATIMVGNPDERWEDIERTKKQLLKLKPDFMHVFFTTPFPGSDLYDMAVENKWIKDKEFSKKWDIRRAEKPVMEINFTTEELIRIKSELQNSFFYSNYMDYLKRPMFMGKVLFAFLTDMKSLATTLKRFAKSKRIDDLAEGAMKSYRLKYKTAER